MAQLLIDLNIEEQHCLKRYLSDNQIDCGVRGLYDYWAPPSQRERCAIEGGITQELLQYLQNNFVDQIRSGIRFAE